MLCFLKLCERDYATQTGLTKVWFSSFAFNVQDFDDRDLVESATDALQDEVMPATGTVDIDVEMEGILEPRESKERKERLQVHGIEIVGRRITIFWSAENTYFNGKITGYNSRQKQHRVVYDDGDSHELNLVEERFDFLD